MSFVWTIFTKGTWPNIRLLRIYYLFFYCLLFIFLLFMNLFIITVRLLQEYFSKCFFFHEKQRKLWTKIRRKQRRIAGLLSFFTADVIITLTRVRGDTRQRAVTRVCVFVSGEGEGRGGGVDALGDNSRGWSPAVSTMCRWLPYSCSYEVQTKATW